MYCRWRRESALFEGQWPIAAGCIAVWLNLSLGTISELNKRCLTAYYAQSITHSQQAHVPFLASWRIQMSYSVSNIRICFYWLIFLFFLSLPGSSACEKEWASAHRAQVCETRAREAECYSSKGDSTFKPRGWILYSCSCREWDYRIRGWLWSLTSEPNRPGFEPTVLQTDCGLYAMTSLLRERREQFISQQGLWYAQKGLIRNRNLK